jgi:hypothetical protein
MTRQKDNGDAKQTGDLERARATPLRPMVWMTSVLVWATVIALLGRVPTWASVFLCAVTGISFVVLLTGYVYLFTSDRDALRAERWRRGVKGQSSRERAHQQPALDEDHRTYIGSEGVNFSVPRVNEQELEVAVVRPIQGEVE